MSEAKKLDNLFEAVETARKLERQAIGEWLEGNLKRHRSIMHLAACIDWLKRGERPE